MKALETLVIVGGLAFSTPAMAQENEGLGGTAEATDAAYVSSTGTMCSRIAGASMEEGRCSIPLVAKASLVGQEISTVKAAAMKAARIASEAAQPGASIECTAEQGSEAPSCVVVPKPVDQSRGSCEGHKTPNEVEWTETCVRGDSR